MVNVLYDCELHPPSKAAFGCSSAPASLRSCTKVWPFTSAGACRSVSAALAGTLRCAVARPDQVSLANLRPDICAKLVAQLDTSYADFDAAFKVCAVVLALLPLDQRQPSVHSIRHSLLEAGALRVRRSHT